MNGERLVQKVGMFRLACSRTLFSAQSYCPEALTGSSKECRAVQDVWLIDWLDEHSAKARCLAIR